MWRDNNITLKYKTRCIRALMYSIFVYEYETWTLTAELQRMIQATEMRCYWYILGISYKDRVTNEMVRITHCGQL